MGTRTGWRQRRGRRSSAWGPPKGTAAAAPLAAVVGLLLTLLLLAATGAGAFQSCPRPSPSSLSRPRTVGLGGRRPCGAASRLYAEQPPRQSPAASFLSGLFGGKKPPPEETDKGKGRNQQQPRRPSGGGPPLTPQKQKPPASFAWPPVAGRTSKAEASAGAEGGGKGKGVSKQPPAVAPLSAFKQQQRGRGPEGDREDEEEEGGEGGPLDRVRAAVAGVTARLQTPVAIGPILSRCCVYWLFCLGFVAVVEGGEWMGHDATNKQTHKRTYAPTKPQPTTNPNTQKNKNNNRQGGLLRRGVPWGRRRQPGPPARAGGDDAARESGAGVCVCVGGGERGGLKR